ncbi:MAG TPA: hypothetical protein VEC14_04635 [Reyranellaceae bacterium]|nr:hypothetical protein [Reyranellaceae bacterium]
METAYYLIVEQKLSTGRTLRTLDDYLAPDRLIADAADYEAGEFPGRWVGALELTFDRTGLLVDARRVEDLAGKVHAELAGRPSWRRRQAVAERWEAS